jgi:Xaa-Pro aminopeptidase
MPILTPNNDTKLEEGMVFCVEPPYYELGNTGFQVEDTWSCGQTA